MREKVGKIVLVDNEIHIIINVYWFDGINCK